MRETLGLDTSEPDGKVNRNRTDEDFRFLSQRFIADMLGEQPRVTSRRDSRYITAYARELGSLPGQSHQRVEPEPINEEPEPQKQRRRSRPRKLKQTQRIPLRPDIEDALKALGSMKLESLYHSVCRVSLQGNTPLLAVGVWSFFETLTARIGRDLQISFYNFLSQNKLEEYGLGTKKQTKPLRDALERILHFGNTTKHHDTAATFNGDQLANDMECLGDVILKLIEDGIAQKKMI